MAESYWVFFGTYTDGASEGIYAAEFDSDAGTLGEARLVAEMVNPSFLELHPNGRFLYAVSEQAAPDGAVSAFSIDPETAELTLLNTVSSEGSAPCHLQLDGMAQGLAVANYSSGNVAAYKVGRDGKLSKASSVEQHQGSSVNPQRQEGPHAHSVNFSPGNEYLVVADLGVDTMFVYEARPASGVIVPHPALNVKLTPGAGPRHFVFDPNGTRAYAVNELDSTVTAFGWDESQGQLTAVQTISTLPDGFTGSTTTAEILLHPSGEFLYASNRGHDSLAMFRIHRDTGVLRSLGHEPTRGMQPRNFRISPDGRFLLAANQRTNSVVVFAVDETSGKLGATWNWAQVDAPVCVRFLER